MQESLKIVLWPLHYLPYIGGSERQVHCLALAFQQLGHKVIAIANHAADAILEDRYEGIDVFRFPFLSAFAEGDLRKIKKNLDHVSSLIAAFSPDIVNTHALVNALNFYQNRSIKVPLCATTHGGLIEKEHCNKPECVKLLTKADQVSAPAQHFLDLLQSNASRVIPNGLPIAETPIQPIPKHPVMAVIGRLAPEKGFDIALEAAQQLRCKYPNLKLLLIGDGPEKPFLWQRIEDLDLQNTVEKIGAIPPERVHSFIDQSQIVCIPSTHECLNLVAIETAMRGRPVIASDIPGLKETIEDGVTGFLIPPRNPHILAKQADLLFSCPDRAQKMGHNAFEKMTRLFSLKTTVQNYLKMYYDALHANRQRSDRRT